jgi:hypothetical protein
MKIWLQSAPQAYIGQPLLLLAGHHLLLPASKRAPERGRAGMHPAVSGGTSVEVGDPQTATMDDEHSVAWGEPGCNGKAVEEPTNAGWRVSSVW